MSLETFDNLLPSEINWKQWIYYQSPYYDENAWKYGGRWTLYAQNDVQKLDDRWIALRKLCDDGTLAEIKSSTGLNRIECVTVCYTSEPDNEKEVKIAADEIRKLIEYQHTMYYKRTRYFSNLDVEEHLYEHTVDGEFRKRETDFLLPSEIFWKSHFTYFFTEANTEILKQNGGKWILYAFGDISIIDQRFIALRALCSNGTLLSIASATIACKQLNKFGTVCHTSDSKDVAQVKKAADEIRKLTDYKYVMFYSTSEKYCATDQRDRETRGHFKYMHTVKGGFYKRDKYMRWIKFVIS